MKCYAVENHPNDSRATIDPDGIVQTLNARMGTGGGNTPIILMAHLETETNVRHFRKSYKSPKHGTCDKWIEDDVTNTLNCFDIGDIRTSEIVVAQQRVGSSK